jgi:predicted Holliday junction resolvase-like endonuclease
MSLLLVILLIVGIAIGFFVGKYIYDKAKWEDKRKIFAAEWRLKLETLENKYKNQILELQKNNEINTKNLIHDWQLRYTNDLAEIKELFQSAEKYMRYDAVKRSKRTLLGKLWEQVSPYLPKFPFRPSDMKFLGSPIDFIIFDGASENDIKQVIFLEVKSGDSKLSTQERKLKKAIEGGNVSWKLFNVDKPEEIRIKEQEKSREMKDETQPHEVYKNIDDKISSIKEEEIETDSE